MHVIETSIIKYLFALYKNINFLTFLLKEVILLLSSGVVFKSYQIGFVIFKVCYRFLIKFMLINYNRCEGKKKSWSTPNYYLANLPKLGGILMCLKLIFGRSVYNVLRRAQFANEVLSNDKDTWDA